MSARSQASSSAAVSRSREAVSTRSVSACRRPSSSSPLHELLELAVGLFVVLVGRRAKPAERRVAGVFCEQAEKLERKGAEELALGVGEAEAIVAFARALDGARDEHQSSWRIVAQRPCAWRRATSCSAFSRAPPETTALPSLCTWSMSFVAFSRS